MAQYYLLTIAAICAHFVRIDAQRTPSISFISTDQIKDIGGSVELECSVQYAKDFPVLWIKLDSENNNPLLISSASTLIIRDSRFSLRFDPSSSLFTLQIKDLQETDAGVYQCQILININNRVTGDVGVVVRMPPIISDNSSRSMTVSEGQAAVLECYATGHPLPRISWRRENNALLPTGGTVYRGNILKILHAKKDDRGTYYCVAENEVGKGAWRNVALNIEFSPVITISRPRVTQAIYHDADLQCSVAGYPKPLISWIKDDVQLSSNRMYSISKTDNEDSIDTSLRAISIDKRQLGFYTCKAVNKLGYAEDRIELTKSDSPVCPPACGQPKSFASKATPTFFITALFYTSTIHIIM